MKTTQESGGEVGKVAGRCECKLCQRSRATQVAIDAKDVAGLARMVEELANENCVIGEELSMANALIDGSWPDADLVIQLRRAKQEATS